MFVLLANQTNRGRTTFSITALSGARYTGFFFGSLY
jgi:hypothetical protein